MEHQWIDLTIETVDSEHLCCAIADKKHQAGASPKTMAETAIRGRACLSQAGRARQSFD